MWLVTVSIGDPGEGDAFTFGGYPLCVSVGGLTAQTGFGYGNTVGGVKSILVGSITGGILKCAIANVLETV